MSAAANKKLIQEIYSHASNRTSSPVFRENVADDVRWVVTGQNSWSHTFVGMDAIANNLLGRVRELMAESTRTVAFNFVADGDYVVVEAKGDNVTKTGVRYDNDYCMIWRFENGKIKEIKEYCDSALVEKVLGPFPVSRLPGAKVA